MAKETSEAFENKGLELDGENIFDVGKNSDLRKRKKSRAKDELHIKKWTIREKDEDKIRQRRLPKRFKTKFMNNLAQQKLKDYSPVFTPAMVIVIVFVTGLFCIPIGIVLLAEVIKLKDNEFGQEYGNNTDEWITLNIIVEKDLKPPVNFYYKLENFPQNHRKFIEDGYFPDEAFLGDRKTKFFEDIILSWGTPTSINDTCNLLNLMDENITWFNKNWFVSLFKRKVYDVNKNKSILLPHFHTYFVRNYIHSQLPQCGEASNSMFFDNFSLTDTDGNEVPMTIQGINHEMDRKYVRNPKENMSSEEIKEFMSTCPIIKCNCSLWAKPIWELDPQNPDNNGLRNAHFLVWRRASGYSTFIKLYKKLDPKGKFENGLPKGVYNLTIFNHFGLVASNAIRNGKLKKSFIISGHNSWIGMRCVFLPIAYLVVGVICLLGTPILIFLHKKYGISIDDMTKEDLSEFYYVYREPISLNFY